MVAATSRVNAPSPDSLRESATIVAKLGILHYADRADLDPANRSRHNKADCPNERVDRPFAGTCRECNEEGHPAAECPNRICRLCNGKGHKAIDCKAKRVHKFEGVAEMTVDEAWNKMKEADKEKDLDSFRAYFMGYARAMSSGSDGAGIDLVDLENGFRTDGMNAHLVAKAKEIPDQYTIVDFAGNADRKYVLGIQWNVQSRRRVFSELTTEDPAENLERLKDCGLVMDRGVPKCTNCERTLFTLSLSSHFTY